LKPGPFSKAIGISESFLSQILSGERTGERSVIDIANELGVPVCQLIGNHDMEAHQICEKIRKASRKKRNTILKILDS